MSKSKLVDRRRKRQPRRGKDAWVGRHIVICNWRDRTHPEAGGAELYCERVAMSMHERGAVVTLLCSRHAGSARTTRTPYGAIVRLGNAYTVYPLVLVWLFWHRNRIDAVLDSQNGIPFFSPVALKTTTPISLLVHHVHQQQFELYFPRWLSALGRVLENQVSSRVYGSRPVCVVSPSSRAALREKLSFNGAVFVVPCGQNAMVSEAAEDEPSRSDVPRLIYVGRLVRQKRIGLLLDALVGVHESYPDAELHLVGDGEERAAIMNKANDLGLSKYVHLHGRVPDARRDELVRSSWLFVTASLAEGWGISVIEAAGQGVPSVAFRVAGLKDAIADKVTGWLCDEEEPLGEAIVAALDEVGEQERAREWSQRCRAWAKQFSWSASADRILGIFASERDRLNQPLLDRRELSDVATVVSMPRARFSLDLLDGLRRQDQLRFSGSSVELLLLAADEDGARRALQRLRLRVDGDVTMRVACARDLLGWDLDVGAAELGFFERLESVRAAPFFLGRLDRHSDGATGESAAVSGAPLGRLNGGAK